jgi:hypothetical protein
MSSRRMLSRAAVALLVLTLPGCSGSPSPAPTGAVAAATGTPAPTRPAVASAPPSAPAVTPSPTPATTPVAGWVPAGEDAIVESFPAGHFGSSATITNRWLPFVGGTQWTFEGSAIVEGKRIPRRIVITTTDLTKVIDHVASVVNYETDFNSGELVEAELAFFAQADDGTVWNMGEHPEEFEDGQYVESPTWLAGIGDSKAGVMMLADPEVATPSYSEGWGPAVGWTDRGRVFEVGSSTCVTAGCYDDVLVVDEFNRDEPDAHQLKYYAPGIGGVRVGWAGAKEEEQEVMQLVKVVHLDAAALGTIRSAALALEKHAYEVSKDVYGTTEPMVGG